MTLMTVGNTGAQTSATLLTEHARPAERAFQLGDPPAVYDIRRPRPLMVLHRAPSPVPYASRLVPTPQIKHYANGEWVGRGNGSSSKASRPEDLRRRHSLSPYAVGNHTHLRHLGAVPAGRRVSDHEHDEGRPERAGEVQARRRTTVSTCYAESHPERPNSEGRRRRCSASVDLVETTTANASGLLYDAVSGLTQYNWKTSSAWKGQCRTLILKFSDGQELKANFQFN